MAKPNNRPSPIKTLESRIVWSSPWYSVRQDQIILPGGQTGIYNVVQHPGAVFIIPVTDQGEIILVYHYRYTVDDWCWEIPAGGLQKGKSAEECAREELRQEVGGKAAALDFFGKFYAANGISDEVAHVFIATGVALGRPALEPAEVIQVHPKPIKEVLRMARANEISDGPSALAILLCEQQLLALAQNLPAHEPVSGS